MLMVHCFLSEDAICKVCLLVEKILMLWKCVILLGFFLLALVHHALSSSESYLLVQLNV